METVDCIKGRRSIRRFTDEPVSRETILNLVELASYAPSWKNTQVVRYTAVESEFLRKELADNCVLDFAGNEAIIKKCPMLVVVSFVHGISGYEKNGEASTSKEDRWEVFDAGIAAQTFCLAAHNEGLGTVIMGIFDEDKVAEVLGLPENQTVAALVALGYPDIDPKAPRRRLPEDLVSFK